MSLGMAQNQQPHYPQRRIYKIFIFISYKSGKGVQGCASALPQYTII